MADRQWYLGGYGLVNETGTRQWYLGGYGALNDTTPLSNDVTVTLVGASTSVSAGSLVHQHSLGVNGVSGSTGAGEVTPDTPVVVSISGSSASSSSGDISLLSSVPIVGSSASSGAGEVTPVTDSTLTVSIEGVGGSSGSGQVSNASSVLVVGGSATVSAGAISKEIARGINLPSDMQARAGAIKTQNTQSPIGVSSTASTGNISIALLMAIDGALSTVSTSAITPIDTISILGVGGSTGAGSVSVSNDAIVNLVGVGTSSSTGSLSILSLLPIEGSSGSTGVGEVSISNAQIVELVGVSGQSETSGIAHSRVAPLGGASSQGYAGSISPSRTVSITGGGATSSVGGVSVGYTSILSGVGGVSSTNDISLRFNVGLVGASSEASYGDIIAGEVKVVGITGAESIGSCGDISFVASVFIEGVSCIGRANSVTTTGGNVRSTKYDWAVKMAKEMIQKYGILAEYRMQTISKQSLKPWRGNTLTETSYPVNVFINPSGSIKGGFRQTHAHNNGKINISYETSMLMEYTTFTPTIGGVVICNNKTYVVKMVDEIKYDGEQIYFRLYLDGSS